MRKLGQLATCSKEPYYAYLGPMIIDDGTCSGLVSPEMHKQVSRTTCELFERAVLRLPRSHDYGCLYMQWPRFTGNGTTAKSQWGCIGIHARCHPAESRGARGINIPLGPLVICLEEPHYSYSMQNCLDRT